MQDLKVVGFLFLEEGNRLGKTNVVMIAYAFGNAFDLVTTLAFCKKYDL